MVPQIVMTVRLPASARAGTLRTANPSHLPGSAANGGSGVTGSTVSSFAVDTTVPTTARMYDFWLGGHDNFAADRAAALKVSEAAPEAQLMTTVILSFRVSRGCDLRRPVVDSVADGTLAA